MAVLNREAFHNLKRRYLVFSVADLGDVRLQSLSQKMYAEMRKVLSNEDAAASAEQAELYGMQTIFPTVIAAAVVDDDGRYIFDSPADPAIAELETAHLIALGQAIMEFWGLDKRPDEALASKN